MNRILIAEDETRLAAFIEKGFRKNGFMTTVASDGEQALQKATNEEFELLLLDLGLPIKDGWAVLQELRSQDENLPIIIITALSDERIRTTALSLGANDYVTKPFRFGDLLAKVNSYLEKVNQDKDVVS
ncbi:response regulator transcription factor [Calothrix sp. UHCC 0171]|uniref:response regulator transcription factor n=1 Tax=Calothrix sp. UHCC 0171 TaxID=3110245 RepID=UPI002B212D51|nr:response regulator transcription factor [Calothrix sp. UHCC 0171]MEA5573049.1 response regulator transcription factor [Calothrix sp. UHCC 0171]